MRNTKQAVQAAIETIPALIEETVSLEQQAAALLEKAGANRTAIKSALIAHKISRQPTANGYEALIIEKVAFSWNVDRLEDVLTKEQFAELCPRKGNGEKLRSLMEGSEAERAKELRGCAKGTKSAALELRAPAEREAAERQGLTTPAKDEAA
jgi:hypothetical protein